VSLKNAASPVSALCLAPGITKQPRTSLLMPCFRLALPLHHQPTQRMTCSRYAASVTTAPTTAPNSRALQVIHLLLPGYTACFSRGRWRPGRRYYTCDVSSSSEPLPIPVNLAEAESSAHALLQQQRLGEHIMLPLTYSGYSYMGLVLVAVHKASSNLLADNCLMCFSCMQDTLGNSGSGNLPG
jgi:hypothetical protein